MAVGDAKRDPVTGAIANRTRYEPTNPKLAQMLWLVAPVDQGPKFVGDEHVSGWDDLPPWEQPQ